jgi:hypothetical protein
MSKTEQIELEFERQLGIGSYRTLHWGGLRLASGTAGAIWTFFTYLRAIFGAMDGSGYLMAIFSLAAMCVCWYAERRHQRCVAEDVKARLLS